MTAAQRAGRAAGGGTARASAAARKAKPAGRAGKSGGAGGVSIRVYRQGLGDCILLRVQRPGDKDFKLLIDCGLVLGAQDRKRGKPAEIMTRVVEDIVKETGGEVDAVAITHEHWDHLSGFDQAKEAFKKLAVGEVWLGWTEDPADPLAIQLKKELGRAKQALALCGNALHAARDAATRDMLEAIALTPFGVAGPSTSAILDAVKSGSAFKSLKKKPRICKLDEAIPLGPNARIYALGPPYDGKLIRKIRPSKKNPETYGFAVSGDGALSLGVLGALKYGARAAEPADEWLQEIKDAAPFHRRVTIPLSEPKDLEKFSEQKDGVATELANGPAIRAFFTERYYEGGDWRRIDSDWLGSAPELAMAIQSYTNNTSLVLALEIGEAGKGDVFLFAGDAQVGNWESWQDWKLPKDKPSVTGPDLLARTIFYKVGHHGSHNATLREHGLEQMNALKVAVCPVDQKQAEAKHWDKMPLPKLMAALKAKGKDIVVLRTDETPSDPPDHVKVDDLYFEITL